jgi:hypothetical protein
MAAMLTTVKKLVTGSVSCGGRPAQRVHPIRLECDVLTRCRSFSYVAVAG